VHRGNHDEGAQALQAAVEEAGQRTHFHVGDGASADAAEAGAKALLEVAGPRSVKMLVHSIANASVGDFTSGSAWALHPRQFETTFDAMAHSFVYWTQALVRHDLLAPSARILALGNPLDTAPLHGCGLIAAAKGALEVYVRYLALELGPLGHRVNILRFGAADTVALRTLLERKRIDSLAPTTPAGRQVDVEEVARFVSILAGDAGAWFNGAAIDFTGGEALGHYNALVQGQRAKA
jgi:NAD(P)-dependent dehydrogenase (short-subunit alcohol dehydrogenase family)